jgi:hypothetical protein
MNEEQAVLDFFAQQENLPLALVVAEQVDTTRRNMNNDFWRKLAKRLESIAPAWQVELTYDRNTENCLVGAYLQPASEQPLYLCPMLEQQIIGDSQRIYFGLIWSDPAASGQPFTPEVDALRKDMLDKGYKSSDKFLIWQWTPYYPRSKDFLLRYAEDAEAFLDEASNLLREILDNPLLASANASVQTTSQSAAVVSLDALRSNLKQP